MEIKMIPREKIIPDPDQPREHFEKESIQDLANSMKEFGLLQPIVVKPSKNGAYEIIAGERRWRASKFANMKELPAIVKHATKQEQEVQGLIENVHREDLDTPEKGKKTYQIFQLYGIDLDSKELAGKLNWIDKHGVQVATVATDKQIVTVCKKINKPYRTIRQWLEAISISPEIQKTEIQKPKEEKVAGTTLARLSTIEDEEFQKKAYAKIEEQEMGQETASRFITKIKQVDEKTREDLLTPGMRVDIIGDIEQPHTKVPVIPADVADEIREAMEQSHREFEERMKDPRVKAKQEKYRNWAAHLAIRPYIEGGWLLCPYCGKPASEHLVWKCQPNKPIRDSIQKAIEDFGD